MEAFADALFKDLGKPRLEAIGFEIAPTINQAKLLTEKLEEWTKPEILQDVSDFQKSLNPKILKTPKGPVLIIAPWNFPFAICMMPIVCAIASGNPAACKPSEITPNLAQLFAELLPKYLDADAYAIVNGAVAETTKLLELKWAHGKFFSC